MADRARQFTHQSDTVLQVAALGGRLATLSTSGRKQCCHLGQPRRYSSGHRDTVTSTDGVSVNGPKLGFEINFCDFCRNHDPLDEHPAGTHTDGYLTSTMVDPVAALCNYNVLEVIFSYLELEDLSHCSQVCKSWHHFLNDENSDVWRWHCLSKLPKEALKSDLLASVSTYKTKLRAYFHAWSPNDCSRNVYIKPNGFTLHRNPVAQSTDAARGKIGFRHGRHAWEVIWEGPLGTVAVIGISTKEAVLQCHGYVALLGSDDQSWGWNLVENHLLHNGDMQGSYPLLNNAPKYQVGERIRIILDCDDNTLSFEKNYEFLGVAFRGLPDKKLYPTVSAVYGNTEVSMVYLGTPLDG